jgi:D-alanyl-D-alanine carboxypeptidase (penicillin-binding protein 5/6)
MFRIAFLFLLLGATTAFAETLTAPYIAAHSYYLTEVESGQPLAALNPDERIEPASLTKLMSAYVTFRALRDKRLSANQTVPVSQLAWKAEGSRMFIEPQKPVTVDELLHGMIIQSGNDATLALAEAVSGSEEGFVQLMNRTAAELGMTNTHFANATGLPHPQHYSTARDIGLMAIAIIRDFPEYYPLYSIKEYRYNNITQPNRNRLLWMDSTVDGMKTGHTESAGFCLVSTAHRGDRRLLSVVIGTSSDNARTIESQKLLNWGFQTFETQRLFVKNATARTLEVFKGSNREVKAGFLSDVWMTSPVGESSRLRQTLTTLQPIVAPVAAGQKLGTLEITFDGQPVASHDLVALEPVPVGNAFTRAWDSARLLLK